MFQVDQQAVVAGRSEVADVGVGGELSGEAAVVGDEAVGVQSLKRVRQIAFDDQVSEEIGDELGAIGLRETRYECGAVSRRRRNLVFEPWLRSDQPQHYFELPGLKR